MKSGLSRGYIFAFIAIALLGLALRLYKLDIIPQWTSDEGRWALGGASAIRYDDWLRGGWQFGYLSPVWTGLIYLCFRLIGPSVLHARLLSVTLGMACLPMLYVICRRCGYSNRMALLSVLFLAADGVFFLANRLSMSDTALTFFVMATLMLFMGGSAQRLISVLLLSAVVCTKATGVFTGAVLYFYQIFSRKEMQQSFWMRYIRPAIMPLIGVAIAGGCFLWIYKGHPTEFVNAWNWELHWRRSQSAVWFNPFVRESLFDTIKYFVPRMPFLLLAATAGFIHMLKKRDPKHVLPLLWFILGTGIIIVQNHQPHRYYIPIIPVVCLMAAWAVDRVLELSVAHKAGKKYKTTVVAGIAMMILYNMGATWAYYMLKGNADVTGRDVTAWINTNLTPDTCCMGIATYGIGSNVKYYPQEYFNHDVYLTDAEIKQMKIEYIIYDDEHWRLECREKCIDFERNLPRRFTFVKRIGLAEIWKTKADLRVE